MDKICRLLYGQHWQEQMGGQRRRLITPKWVSVKKALRNKLLFPSLPPSLCRIYFGTPRRSDPDAFWSLFRGSSEARRDSDGDKCQPLPRVDAVSVFQSGGCWRTEPGRRVDVSGAWPGQPPCCAAPMLAGPPGSSTCFCHRTWQGDQPPPPPRSFAGTD